MKKIQYLITSILCLSVLLSCEKQDEESKPVADTISKAELTSPQKEAKAISRIPTFRWNKVQATRPEIFYQVWVSSDEHFTSEKTFKAIDIEDTFYTFESKQLQPLSKYFWKVIASDDKNNLSESEIFSFTTIDVDLRVNLLEPKDKTALTTNQTTIKWKALRNEVYNEDLTFSVYLRNGSASFSTPFKKGIKEEEITLNDLKGNATYYWAIAAVNAKGTEVLRSDVFTFTTPNTLPTPARLSNRVEELLADDKNSVALKFKWEKSTDEDRIFENGKLRPEVLTYEFYLSEDENFTQDEIKMTSESELSYTAVGLDFSKTYWAKVVTKDENGGVVSSNIVSKTTQQAPIKDELTIVEGTWTDSRDGKTYKTVTINGVTWLAENYAYIPENQVEFCSVYGVQGEGKTANELKTTENYNKYGVLYAMEMLPTIAPQGWRVATDEDWKTIELLSGMAQTEINTTGYRNRGEMMHKFISLTQRFSSPAIKPTNEMKTGFTYGGYFGKSSRETSFSFKGTNEYVYVWTGTKQTDLLNKEVYWYRAFSYRRKAIERDQKGDKFRMYVRLVKE